MINQHIRAHGIDLQLETELKAIESDEQGRAKGVITSKGESIESKWVGLTVGVAPNIDFLKNSDLFFLNIHLTASPTQLLVLQDACLRI